MSLQALGSQSIPRFGLRRSQCAPCCSRVRTRARIAARVPVLPASITAPDHSVDPRGLRIERGQARHSSGHRNDKLLDNRLSCSILQPWSPGLLKDGFAQWLGGLVLGRCAMRSGSGTFAFESPRRDVMGLVTFAQTRPAEPRLGSRCSPAHNARPSKRSLSVLA